MTREDTANVLITLQHAYPLFYSNKTQKDFSAIANVWHRHIGEFDFEVIFTAVELMIDNETVVPTIALLKRYIPMANEIVRGKKVLGIQDEEKIARFAR